MCPTCNIEFPMSQIELHAEFCCSGAQEFPIEEKPLKDTSSVVKLLANNMDNSDQLFIIIRRGCPLRRVLEIWKREVKKDPSCLRKRVFVSYSGEHGIDSGAIANEFYNQVIPEIGTNMFPNGIPQDSTSNIQNYNFMTCGQIVASSLAQGGPPPCFLDESVFNLLVEPCLKLHEIDQFKHLTEKDRALLKSVEDDLSGNTQIVIEYGYTGPIIKKYSKQIINTMAIHIISKRILYLKEFLEDMQPLGLADIVQNNPNVCRELFVAKTCTSGDVDANYVFSIMQANYSPKGSSKREVEECIMDLLQDFLFKLEDENHNTDGTEAIAYDTERENKTQSEDEDEDKDEDDPKPKVLFMKPDLTPKGVLGWLTGQKHKPLNKDEKLAVSVFFNHKCMDENPGHTICFPYVGACGKEITLPVQHMKKAEEFNNVFFTALKKGQAFAKT